MLQKKLPSATRRYLILSLSLFALCALLALGGCRQATPGSTVAAPQTPGDQATMLSTGARRADPGYIQYLERLSMAGSQTELARVVSGSQLAWLRPASAPLPGPLLAVADAWLSINPLVTLPETKRSIFASLSSPLYWQVFGKGKFGGLYIAPTSGSGALWAYNRKASIKGDDTIQYTFSQTAGPEEDYFRMLQAANTNRKLLGLEVTPATTGLGPDFFLAARYHRQFSGIYCMVELPKKLWNILPPVSDQWQGVRLDDQQVALLASQNLLPPAMSQDFLPTGKEGGWAVTSEIHGVDGLMRRWAYRYYSSPDRPVLHWEDPSTGARRILSGSAIRNVGMLGSALIGMRLDGLYGLDATAPNSPQRFVSSPGDEAATSISREIRRYGGWAWLKDELPLSLVYAMFSEGPDFFRDSVFSPGIEHSLLTGSTVLLHAMLDDALALGLDMRRFVHATTGEEGVSYRLPHLAEVASGNKSASRLLPYQAEELRQNSLKEATHVVFTSTISSPDGEDKPPLQQKHLHTTPAGIAALALGAGNAHSLTEEMEPLARDGHFLQVFIRAMLPGLFMISGQDISGALPLSWYAMQESSENWDISMTSRGAHAYTQTVPSSAVTALGVPRARTLYSTPDVQMLEEDSFLARLAEILGIRTTYGVASGTFYGRFNTTAAGCFAFAVLLPSPNQATPPEPTPVEQPAMPPVPAAPDEAVINAPAANYAMPAAKQLKRQHEEVQRLRQGMESHIITASSSVAQARSSDAALLVVVNFSRDTIRQVLNIYQDPELRTIRQKGEPVLLTPDRSGRNGIGMSYGEQTVTLTLGPWRCAAVVIGRR